MCPLVILTNASQVPWDSSPLQYHSHVEVCTTVNANVVCGDRGVIEAKVEGGYRVNFIKQVVPCFLVSSSAHF